MSSSVTRADVSSWQLQEVTTNPISPSPWSRSATAKRARQGGRQQYPAQWDAGFAREAGKERKGVGNKGPSLIVGVTFCTSGDPVPARPVPAGPSHPHELTRLPGTQLIASPYLETLLDFDGVYLGGQLTIPFLLPPTAGSLILNSTPYPEAPASVGAGGKHFSTSRWAPQSTLFWEVPVPS